MGVQNLWKVLEKGDAVVKLKGSDQFQQITEAVENKVIAVDLSAWLMQAQTQPALLANFDSPYARAAKVVFDRTIHWLRHGCLPVFVIEGQTPQAKLDKLRHRCIAQYGPQRRFDVGNRAGGQFDRLGQSMKRLLESFGVPCVQAVGEGEAMCAALNICGWAHACHTLDVDALLFGAITVYRNMHLATDKPKEAELTICRREDVQRILGISSGGDAALTAIAQLAGGDYDTTGVENVGEVLALAAVRYLLRDCQTDDTVLQKLEAIIAAGPNAELDALKRCTGCRACGHESGTSNSIRQHPAKRGCAACGCASGCIPRDFAACECEFHRRAEERLLNRVVRLAELTPGFVGKCRMAADTYQEQLRLAISAVQREYGLAQPNSEHNVFRWIHRPDVRAISDFMCKYISDWNHHQVRLKLLPLLLEWDVRQGPQPSSSSGVQFVPTSIRKVSTRGADDMKDAPKHERQAWRYILDVKRLTTSSSSSGSQHQYPDDRAAEDLAIDQAWLNNTARSRPRQQNSAGGLGPGDSNADDEEETYMYSQGAFAASQATQQGFDSYTEGMSLSQAAAGSSLEVVSGSSGGGRRGSKAAGSLQFAEHRSVRCSLIDSLWPELTKGFRNPPAATSGRAGKSGGSRKKAAAAAADSTQQRSLKDFFGTTKGPHTAVRPGAKPGSRLAAGHDGSIIPGLAGITAGCSTSTAVAQERGLHGPSKLAVSAELSRKGAAGAAGASQQGCSSDERGAGQAFMNWLDIHVSANDKGAVALQQSTWPSSPAPQAEPYSCSAGATTGSPLGKDQGMAVPVKVAAVANTRHGLTEAVASSSSRNPRSMEMSAAASGCTRGIRRHSKFAGGGMPAGALDRFMHKPSQQQQSHLQPHHASPAPHELQQQQEQHDVLQQLRDSIEDSAQVCDSPDALPLTVRLARAKAASTRADADGSQAAASTEPAAGRQQVVSKTATTATGALWDVSSSTLRPTKKASTRRERERLCSPLNSPAKPQGLTEASSPQQEQQQQLPDQHHAADVRPTMPGAYSAHYLALMHEVGGLSTPQGVKAAGKGSAGRAVQALFQNQEGQREHNCDVIDLLDSPEAAACAAAGRTHGCCYPDVIDLT